MSDQAVFTYQHWSIYTSVSVCGCSRSEYHSAGEPDVTRHQRCEQHENAPIVPGPDILRLMDRVLV